MKLGVRSVSRNNISRIRSSFKSVEISSKQGWPSKVSIFFNDDFIDPQLLAQAELSSNKYKKVIHHRFLNSVASL